MNECPFCGQAVVDHARVCTHCKRNLVSLTPAAKVVLAGLGLAATGCGLTVLGWMILPILLVYLVAIGAC